MSKQVLDVPYVMKKVTASADNINDLFLVQDNIRKMRRPVVKQLKMLLLSGGHFLTPLSVSQNKLLDGNHRYLAMKEAIEENPELKIDFFVMQFKNLNSLEEKKTFSSVNIGTRQSQEDFIKVWFEHIPLGEFMIDRIPCSIYGSQTRIKIKQIVSAHIDALEGKRFSGPISIPPNQLVGRMMEFTRDDINVMGAFMRDMEEVFGRAYDNKYPYYKTTGIYSLYRLWYDNKSVVNRQKFIKSLQQVLFRVSDRQMWENDVTYTGFSACRAFYTKFLDALRLKHPSYGFVGE